MRALQRPPVALPTLTAPGKGARHAAKQLAARATNPKARLGFPPHWNAEDVRGALFAMHGRVCAYCQCYLPQNDPGDVEHFRPKTTYWWLAYEFHNYLLSCGICNRIRKRERFPLRAGDVPCSFADRGHLDREKALLLDPARASDRVEEWLWVDFEDPLCPVAAATDLSPGSEAGQRAETTVRFFKLNENVPLIRQRFKRVNDATKALERVRDAGTDRQRQTRERKLKRMASRYRPHGMAVRQMLSKLAPDLLPTQEDDLLLLVDDLLYDLKVAAQVQARTPKSVPALRVKQEVCWALAVLWRHPPATSAGQVEALLHASGSFSDVRRLYLDLGGIAAP
jgi:hypothetical protein